MGGAGGTSEMGRVRVCHINNSQVGRAGVINVASHCRPPAPRNPGVMGSSWTEVSGRTAETAEMTVGGAPAITSSPPETQPCRLPTRNSLPLVYL